jgi:TRAP-type C4-dicarboxylate transport system substrate-binding protein
MKTWPLLAAAAVDERIFQIVTLPFLARDLGVMKMLVDLCRPAFDRAAEGRWGQKILYIAPWPGAGLWTKKRIETVEDMKGLKTRVYDRNGALLMEAAGATPFVLSFSEVHKALNAGFIDSVLTSTPTAVDAKFWEVLKYYEPLNVEIAASMVTVNLRAFQGLPKAHQDALVTADREMERIMWERGPGWDREMESVCNRNGIEKVVPSRQQIEILEKGAEIIRADWLRTAPPEGKRIYVDFLKKVGR